MIEDNSVTLEHKYVFAVLELGTKTAKLHGIYTSREIANGKKEKLLKKKCGYICVLKKTISGPTLTPIFSY